MRARRTASSLPRTAVTETNSGERTLAKEHRIGKPAAKVTFLVILTHVAYKTIEDTPMRKLKCATVLSLLAVNMIGQLAFAQNSTALLVVPSKATMLVGDTHTFRAVGKDGRMRHNVRWSVSSGRAATLTTDGDEATLQANEPSSSLVLTAYAEGDFSEATLEIRSGTSLPIGTTKWSVTELPGCKTAKIIPAVPSAGGPDVYVQESCPDGTYVRSITEDGRELWRRRIDGPLAPLPPELKGKEEAHVGHINLSAHSLCDDVSSGMTKDAVSKLAQDRSFRLEEKERESNNWVIEERNFRCNILFDNAATVVKKKKIIITD